MPWPGIDSGGILVPDPSVKKTEGSGDENGLEVGFLPVRVLIRKLGTRSENSYFGNQALF